jgi:aminopeptidase
MTDPRIEKIAQILVDYSVQVQPGDLVTLRGSTLSAPMLDAIYRRSVLAGGMVHLGVSLPGLDEFFMRNASLDQIRFISPFEDLLVEKYHKFIYLMSDANTRSMTSVDPTRTVERARSRERLMRREFEREAAGELKWVLSLFPTEAYAQDADMSLAEYEEFVYGACLPEPDDPIGYWERFSKFQQSWVNWLDGKKRVRLVARDTDLSFSIEGRKFINCDGKNNFPDGEVYTGPIENSVNGTVRYSFPAIEDGREVENIWLRFEEGKVVEAKADKGEAFLLKMLDTDAGARRLGEFAIGTNPGIQRFTRNTLFDEKIGGTCHLALGRSYPDSKGENESAIHWDMVCDLRPGGEIWVDDVLIHKDGQFTFDPNKS